jgi:hypothetical protein
VIRRRGDRVPEGRAPFSGPQHGSRVSRRGLADGHDQDLGVGEDRPGGDDIRREPRWGRSIHREQHTLHAGTSADQDRTRRVLDHCSRDRPEDRGSDRSLASCAEHDQVRPEAVRLCDDRSFGLSGDLLRFDLEAGTTKFGGETFVGFGDDGVHFTSTSTRLAKVRERRDRWSDASGTRHEAYPRRSRPPRLHDQRRGLLGGCGQIMSKKDSRSFCHSRLGSDIHTPASG